MAAKHPDDDVLETNLDEVNVEVDEYGNLKLVDATESERDDESETSLSVDEDGNLRVEMIYNAQKLLRSNAEDQDRQASGAAGDDELSTRERQALRRTQMEKHRYSREGMPGEEIEMEYVRNQSLARERRRSFVLAVGGESEVDPDNRAGDTDGEAGQAKDHWMSWMTRDGGRHVSASSAHDAERGERDERDNASDYGWYGRVINFFKNSSPQRLALFFAVVAVVVGVLLTVSLVPASFVYVEYHELALARNRVSGKTNLEDVYHPGCYLLTPDIELIRFNGTAHLFDQELEIFTTDRLPVQVGITLQYFIKPKELGMLFTNYKHSYASVIESVVGSTIKNEGVKFTLDNYRLNRSLVEQDFKEAVAFRLSGNCCPDCCPKNCQRGVSCRNRRLAGRCYRGFHVEVRYFQMGSIDVPSVVSERFLTQAILLIDAEKEVFLQEHAVETKISEKMQKQILNEAAEIREGASAEAEKIRLEAEAYYEQQVQGSYIQAMNKLYRHLNITEEDHKLSVMYIRALEDISDNLYNLNFNTLTAHGQG